MPLFRSTSFLCAGLPTPSLPSSPLTVLWQDASRRQAQTVGPLRSRQGCRLPPDRAMDSVSPHPATPLPQSSFAVQLMLTQLASSSCSTTLYSGTAQIWSFETGQLVKSFDVAEVPIRAGRFIARKNWIVCGSDDFQLRVYNYNTNEKVAAFEAHPDYIRAIIVHPTQPWCL